MTPRISLALFCVSAMFAYSAPSSAAEPANLVLVAADDVAVVELVAKAKQGDTRAQLALAYRYRDGNGVKQDYAEAMRWAHPVADQGDDNARDFVGWMCFEGLGVKRSPEIAVGYFKAAAGKSSAAAWNLGQC